MSEAPEPGAHGRKTRVAVVFGGRSTEHGVSCVSAGSVMSGLDADQFEILPIGITRDGRWVLASGDPRALATVDRTMPEVTGGTPVAIPADPTVGGLVVGGEVTGVDVVFPVLHGAYGEDGTIQGLLELAGLPYVGAGVLASAVAMDKEYTKKLLAAEGLPVGRYAVLRPTDKTLTVDDKERLGLPVFVKPARAGSSFGITRVTDWTDLDDAIATARAVDPKVIIEAGVVGREVECGVLEGLDGGEPEASLPAEIRIVAAGHDWYDFEAKYLDDACEFDVPADLPAEVTERLRTMARRAFVALDCAGLARVDFFVTPDHELVVNEVNTMPGFTPISLFPRMWEASGVAYPQLLERMVRTALRRGTGLR
ncbi:MAG TPA: D-alanine--D-alanine ligase family protein [Mycobacteriales bacterium]